MKRMLCAVAMLLALLQQASLAWSFIFATDTTQEGSAYFLTSFNPNTNVLTGTNDQRTFTSTLESSTVFREAQLTNYQPIDPCLPWAQAYNKAGASSDAAGISAAISGMVATHCQARVLISTLVPVVPCRSFPPLPSQ